MEALELLMALEDLVSDIEALISESEGVVGLHRNGDVATWDELDVTGQYSEWLGESYAQAKEVIRRAKDAGMSDDTTFDDECRICPYCGHVYQVEPKNIDPSACTEECEGCGKNYMAWDEIDVTHYASKDCSLNGEKHEPSEESENRCGKCGMAFSSETEKGVDE